MIPEKISPGLLLAMQDYETDPLTAISRQKKTVGIVSKPSAPQPVRTGVFIYCDENANLNHLLGNGIQINQNRGSIRTAFVPIDRIGDLSQDPAIQRIKPSRYMKKMMDVAPGKVRLPEFKQRTGGLSGRGVIIGIVDTGIASKHPAFQGRILKIWDQVIPGPGVFEGRYGAELIGDLMGVSVDTEGHGTHVAGIAAGKDPTFGGVAPGADLVIVKSTLQDAHIADGIRYIFRVAKEMGRPAVVNLSLGGHADSHDGKDSLSMIIDSLVGPGRIVCCAAGNEGSDNIHGQVVVPKNTEGTLQFRVPDGIVGMSWFNGWYGKDSKLEVSVRSPSGFVTPYQGIIGLGNPVREYKLTDAKVRVVTPSADRSNGDYNFFIQITSLSGRDPLKGGIWQIKLKNRSGNDTKVDTWVWDDKSSVAFSAPSASDTMKIGSPGASAKAITVAAYTTKVSWNDIDNTQREVGLTLDDISEFSSEGPLRNNAQKPDIAAPGAMIVSALSFDSNPDRSYRTQDKYVVMAGTSMATPFITGVIALMLERNPKLTPEEAKTLLKKCSSIPDSQPGSFHPKWGFGLINLDALNL